MNNNYMKIQAPGSNLSIKIMPGHFATNHAHVNYYIDLTMTKTRISEAHEAAKNLAEMYMFDTVVDTIICMEGTEMVGAFLGEELTKAGFLSRNAHNTIYVVPPEYNSNSQMIFPENYLPMIEGKNAILLTASVTTGLAINKAIEALRYYNGNLQGISAIFSAVDEVDGVPVFAIFKKTDIPEYQYNDYKNCPFCKKGIKLDGLINPFGYTRL
ncbi:MAG: orotate phosphoribosyltransferase [Clostridium sp.]